MPFTWDWYINLHIEHEVGWFNMNICASHDMQHFAHSLLHQIIIRETLIWKCCHIDEIVIILMKWSSYWWNGHHWLHWKFSKWQLPVQPLMAISSIWWHFRFSEIVSNWSIEVRNLATCCFLSNAPWIPGVIPMPSILPWCYPILSADLIKDHRTVYGQCMLISQANLPINKIRKLILVYSLPFSIHG